MRCLAILVLALSSHLVADVPDWENPAVFQRNKLPAQATATSFPDRAGALTKPRSESPWYQSLNGVWKFHYTGNLDGLPKDFEKPETDVTPWTEIPVPSNWQLHGHGIPLYSGSVYPFAKNPPGVTDTPPDSYTHHAAENRHPVGSYRRTFVLPEGWETRRTILSFEGVDSAFKVWINGQEAGYSEDSRTTARFDITRWVKPGENTIAVQVHQYCDGSYLESQDTWKLSGIYRDVSLTSSPGITLKDHRVDAGLSETELRPTLRVTAALHNQESDSRAGMVAVELLSPAGVTLYKEEAAYDLDAGASDEIVITAKELPALQPWSAESPSLYRYLITITDKSGKPLSFISGQTGFRRDEIKDGVFLHNGQPVLLKGVIRHDHHSQRGHALTEEDLRHELVMMKRANLNAIRMDHAPSHPRFLDLCDELGLYVIDEPNLDTTGMGDDSLEKNPTWQEARLERVRNLVERDKNHPSVIAWSAGAGASGYRPASDAGVAWIQAHDPSRPVITQDGGNATLAGVFWPSLADCAKEVADQKKASADQRNASLIASYNRALGNSSGQLGDYADLFRNEPLLQGGFIRQWQDETLLKQLPKNGEQRGPARRVVAHGGTFGDQPNVGALCASGIMGVNSTPTATFEEVRKVFQDIQTSLVDGSASTVTVRIRNDRFFETTSGVTASWKLLKNGREAAQGTLSFSPILPRQAAEIKIPTNVSPDPAAEFILRVRYDLAQPAAWTQPGMPIAWDEMILPWGKWTPTPETSSEKPATFTETESEILVQSGDVLARINRKTGWLDSLKRNDSETLIAPLTLDFWRLPTPVDKQFGRDKALAVWRDAGAKATPREITAKQEGKHVVVTVHSEIPVGTSSATLIYRFNGAGEIDIDVSVLPDPSQPDLPRVGLMCGVSLATNKWSWYGKGPHENYEDRQRGAWTALQSGQSTSLLPRYSLPQESGGRTNIRWATFEPSTGGNGLRVDATGSSLLEFTASLGNPKDSEALDPGEPRPRPTQMTLHFDHRQAKLGSADPSYTAADMGLSSKDAYRWSFRLSTLHITPPPAPAKGAGLPPGMPLPPGFPGASPEAPAPPPGTPAPRPKVRPRPAPPHAE